MKNFEKFLKYSAPLNYRKEQINLEIQNFFPIKTNCISLNNH